MIERMAENDKIVTRYMADQEFQGVGVPDPRAGDLRGGAASTDGAEGS